MKTKYAPASKAFQNIEYAAALAAAKIIAKEELLIDTLDAQRSGADFHEVAVWNVTNALVRAYEAGRASQR